MTMLPGGIASLTGLGQPGHTYAVQVGSNLKTWSVLKNVTADSTGALSYTDSTAPLYSYRCYRLKDVTP